MKTKQIKNEINVAIPLTLHTKVKVYCAIHELKIKNWISETLAKVLKGE